MWRETTIKLILNARIAVRLYDHSNFVIRGKVLSGFRISVCSEGNGREKEVYEFRKVIEQIYFLARDSRVLGFLVRIRLSTHDTPYSV